jgi:hypothetical protein
MQTHGLNNGQDQNQLEAGHVKFFSGETTLGFNLVGFLLT